MLTKGIGRWDMVLLFINGTIGAGIFGLPSKLFQQSGIYSLLAFGVTAILVLIIILCFAEVSSRFSTTGGPYLYALRAYGPATGFAMGWLMLWSRVFTYASLINLLVIYLTYLSPAFASPLVRAGTILSITALMFGVNYVGVRSTTKVNNWLTIGKMLPLSIFILAGLFFMKPALLQEAPGKLEYGSFSATVLMTVFAFGGFESVLVNSGEMSDTRRNLPFALITAMGIITLYYCLIQLVSIGTLSTLADTERPLADAASQFLGAPGGLMIVAGAFVSIMGTLNAIMLSGSRLPYALATEKQWPGFFGRVHPGYHTPVPSLILFTILTAVVSLSGSFITTLSISVIIRVMIYLLVCGALIRLRMKDNGDRSYFRIRGGYLLAVAGVGISVWLLYTSKPAELMQVVWFLVAGAVFYIANRFFSSLSINRKTPSG